MDRLQTREIDQFVVLAEELHFSRAAERLGISQPPLSRSIARLERRMGVRLFERSSRTVTLTAAGAVFLEECRRLQDALDAAVSHAQQAARGDRLAVAVRPGTGHGLLARLLREFGGPAPEILFTYDRPAALRNGTADVALLCMDSDDVTGLRTVEIAEEEPVALLPSGHELAARTEVSTTELRTDPRWSERCPPVGFDEILDQVALGRLVAVVGSTAAAHLPPDVVAVAVRDLPSTVLAVGWPAHLTRPEVMAFARHAQRLGGRDRTAPATTP